MSSSCAIESPVSSWISFAALPANVPLSSSIPAGISGKASEPAGMRGWTVKMTCLPSSEDGGVSSGWRMSW